MIHEVRKLGNVALPRMVLCYFLGVFSSVTAGFSSESASIGIQTGVPIFKNEHRAKNNLLML